MPGTFKSPSGPQPSPPCGNCRRRLTADTARRLAIAAAPRQMQPKAAAPTAQASIIVGQHHQTQRDHPESEDRQKSKNAANDKADAAHHPQPSGIAQDFATNAIVVALRHDLSDIIRRHEALHGHGERTQQAKISARQLLPNASRNRTASASSNGNSTPLASSQASTSAVRSSSLTYQMISPLAAT